MSLFSNPAKDAKKIQETIDYRILKAAWDSFAQIQINNSTRLFKVPTPAWFALFSIKNYNGDFNKFEIDELHLLKAITTVHIVYDEIIKALESHTGDEALARYILNTHPNLQQALPREYDNVEKVGSYIVQVIKQYEEMLSKFYVKHKVKIDKTVERLEKEAGLQSNEKETSTLQ